MTKKNKKRRMMKAASKTNSEKTRLARADAAGARASSMARSPPPMKLAAKLSARWLSSKLKSPRTGGDGGGGGDGGDGGDGGGDGGGGGGIKPPTAVNPQSLQSVPKSQ